MLTPEKLKIQRIKNLGIGMYCKELWDLNNGKTLCKECHKLTFNYGNFKLIQEFPERRNNE